MSTIEEKPYQIETELIKMARERNKNVDTLTLISWLEDRLSDCHRDLNNAHKGNYKKMSLRTKAKYDAYLEVVQYLLSK